jgi:glycosyltransferase involved in cell wall biosynthesis
MLKPAPTVLMIFAKFGETEKDHYITNDLADAFAGRGFRVRVIYLPWDNPDVRRERFYVQPNGVEVLVSPLLSIKWFGNKGALIAKWGGSSLLAMCRGRRHFGPKPADLVVTFSPVVIGTFIWFWVLRAARLGSYAYLVDFFPFHHRSTGVRLDGPVFRVTEWIETALLRKFSVIGCMSPRGLEYLRKHYRLRADQPTGIVPLWGPQSLAPKVDVALVRAKHGLPVDQPIAVFGGQITEGRGIEEILANASLAQDAGSNLVFLFVGQGSLAPMVQNAINAGARNLILLGEVGRDDYLTLAASCDVGIIATVPNVDVPTFPSKTIDYLRAGLPVAASVEATTDYGEFVEARGFGLAVAAGQPGQLLAAIAEILSDERRREAMIVAGRQTLRDIFNVEAAVTAMLDQIDQSRCGNPDSSLRPPPI